MSEKMPMVTKKRKSPMDPLPISPMKIFAKESNNEGGKHVEAARARLFHALSHGVSDLRSEPASPKDDDISDLDDPESDRVELPTKSEPALLKRKKKGKQDEGRQAFVMKLFDRSVDLALFEESTPLYPICRAWMKNLPNQADPHKQFNKDDSNMDDMEVDEDPDDYDVEGVLNALNNGDEVNLTMLPRPLPLNDPNDRIPSPVHIEKSDLDAILSVDQDSVENSLPTKEDLLREHHENWVTIRKNWHAAARRNEDRYKDSRAILEAVYSKGPPQSSVEQQSSTNGRCFTDELLMVLGSNCLITYLKAQKHYQ